MKIKCFCNQNIFLVLLLVVTDGHNNQISLKPLWTGNEIWQNVDEGPQGSSEHAENLGQKV